MYKINYFSETSEVQNKTILLRLDLNVPIKNKIIQDETRIKLSLPFIKQLIQKRAKIIIISHLGRPKGRQVPELSLIPIYKYLKKKLDANVYFFMGQLDSEIREKFSYQKEGEVILLENIDFIKRNENDEKFSKSSHRFVTYIHDAFSCLQKTSLYP